MTTSKGNVAVGGIGNSDRPTYRIHDRTSTNKSSEVSCCEKYNPPSSMIDDVDKGTKSSDDLEKVYDGNQNLETTDSDNVRDDNSVHRKKVMRIWQEPKP